MDPGFQTLKTAKHGAQGFGIGTLPHPLANRTSPVNKFSPIK
jgi:hypothetical protein